MLRIQTEGEGIQIEGNVEITKEGEKKKKKGK